MATLLLREDDISKNTPIGGNVETSRLIPAIKSAQITAIKPLLGEAFYADLVEKYKTDTLTEEYETLYEDYIKPMLIHLSTAYYFSYGAYNIGNSGIYKATGSDAESISKDEVDYLVKAQEKTYESYKSGYFEFMKVNAKLFPLYSEEETRSTKRRSYGGWSFGNTGGGNGTTKAMGITNAQYLAILERLDLLDLEVDERVFTVSGVNVDNTDPFNPIIEGISWGDIQGSLLDQTDLVSVLNDKVDKVNGERLINSSEITKLSGIEDNADKTDSENVRAAGALMDDEVANLAQVKAFSSSDYAAALGTDDNYVTDAEKTVIGNTSGENTGDQDLSGLEVKRTNKPITESTYLIKAADVSEFLIFENACTVVVPNGLAANLEFQGKQGGTGQVTFSAESGGTLNVPSVFLAETAEQHCFFGIRTDGSDVSTILGTLKLA